MGICDKFFIFDSPFVSCSELLTNGFPGVALSIREPAKNTRTFGHGVQSSWPPSIPKVFSVVKLLKVNVFPPLSKPASDQ